MSDAEQPLQNPESHFESARGYAELARERADSQDGAPTKSTGPEEPERLPAEEELRGPDRLRGMAERHPDWPPVKVECFLSAHDQDYPEDAAGLREVLERADLYAPERNGWTPQYMQILQKISDDTSPEASQRLEAFLQRTPAEAGFDAGQLRALLGTGVLVMPLDLPDGHPLLGEYERYRDLSSLPDLVRNESDVDSVVEKAAEYYAEFGRLQRERELYIEGQLEPMTEKALAHRPALKDRPELDIAVSIGADHTTLSEDLAAGLDARRTFSRKDFIYPIGSEVVRTYMRGGEPEPRRIKEALVGRLMAGGFVSMYGTHKDSIDKAWTERQLLEAVPDEDLDRVIEAYRTGSEPSRVLEEVFARTGLVERTEDGFTIRTAPYPERGR